VARGLWLAPAVGIRRKRGHNTLHPGPNAGGGRVRIFAGLVEGVRWRPGFHHHPRSLVQIGFVEAGSPSANRHLLDAFRLGLRELGYVEGQNIAIEDRWANGRSERFPAIIAELIQLRVDVIVPASTAGALAAKKATSTVPVVFWGVTDPVGIGLVGSLGRPGGNVTGLALSFEDGLAGKWVDLLKEAAPKMTQLAVLWNPESTNEARVRELHSVAAVLKLTLHMFEARNVNEFDGAFAVMARARLGGLMVVPDPLTLRHRDHVVRLAAQTRLPAAYGFPEFARAGGLLAYGPSVPDQARRAAVFVDKILKGAKLDGRHIAQRGRSWHLTQPRPAELPVEQPTKFELVINLKTAKALGLTIPPSLLQRADQVIE
jgi:putative tryptophan/tyrosine transport system substrate-binding protein